MTNASWFRIFAITAKMNYIPITVAFNFPYVVISRAKMCCKPKRQAYFLRVDYNKDDSAEQVIHLSASHFSARLV